MKKVFLAFLSVITVSFAFAQQKKDWSKIDLDRSGDHIMLQISSDHWASVPDSIASHMKGLSRGLNFAIMMNRPFKSDPRWSVAFGVGVSTSAMFFKNMEVGLTSLGNVLPFVNKDSAATHFKKYKLATTYVEIPVELRYTFNPEKQNKSWKIALGGKVGILANAHTKGKYLEDKNNTVLNTYIEKESKKVFLNSTRIEATARVGVGNFSLFGTYQINAFLKDGAGPADIKPYQVGLCISGL